MVAFQSSIKAIVFEDFVTDFLKYAVIRLAFCLALFNVIFSMGWCHWSGQAFAIMNSQYEMKRYMWSWDSMALKCQSQDYQANDQV